MTFDLESSEQAVIAHGMMMERVVPAMIELAREHGLAVADFNDWKLTMDDETDDACVTMSIVCVPADRHDNYVKHHVDRARKHRNTKRVAMLLMGAAGDNDEAH